MARQFINLAPVQREDAFDKGMRQISSGLKGYGEEMTRQKAMEQKQADRERSQSLSAQKFVSGLAEKGIETTPEERQGIGAAFASGDLSSLGAYSNKLAESEKIRREDSALNKKEDRKLNREYKRAQIGALTKKGQPEVMTSAQRLSKQGEGVKSKVGALAEGLRALGGTRKAISAGYEPEYIDVETPVIGGMFSDDPFTKSRRVLSEVVGRLQSGGAINKDEEKRFVAMGPRAGDTPAMAQKKMDDQKSFLLNKLQAYGFNPQQMQEMGFNMEAEDVAQKEPTKIAMFGDVAGQSVAPTAQAAMMEHPQVNEALQWAQQNPQDPRAQEIIRRAGGQ